MPLLSREYWSAAWAGTIATGIFVFVVAAMLTFALYPKASIVWIAPLIAALILWGVAYAGAIAWPYLTASQRGSNIDDNLPFALEYMSNIVGPGTPFLVAAKQTSNPQVHGDFAREMQRLVRDQTVLGLDRTTALAVAMERSPSARLAEVLQGIATTLAAGGDLAQYLRRKAVELQETRATAHTRAIENIGVLAELFVVAAVAVPLLLLILVVAVAMFGQGGSELPEAGFLLFSVLVPVLYASFAGAIMIYKPPL